MCAALAITDADRSLAFDLGLYLVKLPETEDDLAQASTRVPETWQVKRVLDHRVMGTLRITAVDSLYVTKATNNATSLEETVAEALQWLSPTLRHVRTGEYKGTETVFVLAYKEMRERPIALTECGAKATGADYTQTAAKSDLINGQSHEMCPACQLKLEDKGVKDHSNLSDRRGSASDKQRDFIRRLLHQGACNGRPYLIDTRMIDQMSNRSASAMIDALKSLKDRGWTGDL
jgi:hypothetical protein